MLLGQNMGFHNWCIKTANPARQEQNAIAFTPQGVKQRVARAERLLEDVARRLEDWMIHLSSHLVIDEDNECGGRIK